MPEDAAAQGPTIGDPDVKSAVDKYVRSDSVDVEAREACLPIILEGLGKGKVQLLDLVLYLERPLSDPGNPIGRRLAVRLLSDCLAGGSNSNTEAAVAPALKLNFKHVDTFANFFCSKLHDWQCVEGAIAGIHALLKRHGPVLRTLKASGATANEDDDDDDDAEPLVTGIARKLFREVHTPSHTQPIRKAVLDLVSMLLEEWHDELARLTSDDLSLGEGVNSAIEEERDPRNLLQSFTIIRRLLADYPPACVPDTILVSLFETLTSYFPINFTPPKDDKFGITGDDLRNALSRALGSTKRLADHAVPFFLDSSTDISGAESAATIEQALAMLASCFEAYGTEIAKKHVVSTIKTAQDQVCRTATPCPTAFADTVKRSLATALKGNPVGLHPSWLSKGVDPQLAAWAIDATGPGSEDSLKKSGSRRLLLGAAEAHPVLLERVWMLVSPKLLTAHDGSSVALPEDALSFVLDLVKLAEPSIPSGKPRLAARKLQPALTGTLMVALELLPNWGGEAGHGGSGDHGHSHGDGEECNGHGHGRSQKAESPALAFELLGRLARLAGEDASKDAVIALSTILLPAVVAEGNVEAWARRWRSHIEDLSDDDLIVAAISTAVRDTIEAQAARASELAPALTATTETVQAKIAAGEELQPWLPLVLPRLLGAAGLSLAKRVAKAEAPDPEADAAMGKMFSHVNMLCTSWSKPASETRLRSRSTSSLHSAGEIPMASQAVANAIAVGAIALQTAGVPDDALGLVASKYASVLQLPASLPQLCSNVLGPQCPAELRPGRANALRALLRAIAAKLPSAEATALRRKILESIVSADGSKQDDAKAPVVALLPAALPDAAALDWTLCKKTLPTLRTCVSAQHAMFEPLALEALGSLIESAPTLEEADVVLTDLRSAFGDLLRPSTSSSSTSPADPAATAAARGAARCWAAAAAALLRRGGLADQAASFLEALLGTLERDGPITPYVPLAFLVMMPPNFDNASGKASSSTASSSSLMKLPPLSLQQLSRTTLPSLMSHAKRASGAAGRPDEQAQRSALESATALLCALPAEVACTDCSDALRWCALTGLKRVAQDSTAGVTSGFNSAVNEELGDSAAIFAVQVLQLLLRACSRSTAWVEDDLHSLVPHLVALAVSHRIPLVRLASLQVLNALVLASYGHLTPFKKPLEKALSRSVGDKRREVRLVAVACLNAWHCGRTNDDD